MLQSILRLRLICAYGSELVSDSDTAGITSTHAISVDLSEDNASEPSWYAKDGYQIFQPMLDANDDVLHSLRSKSWHSHCSLQPAAPTIRTHLLTERPLSSYHICSPYSAMPAGRTSLNSVALQRAWDTANPWAGISPL